MSSKLTKQPETVELAPNTLAAAYRRAESLGLSLSEYVQSLITKDAEVEIKDPWREPVPKEVSARWEKDLAEFEEEDQKGLQPSFTTTKELIDDLDS